MPSDLWSGALAIGIGFEGEKDNRNIFETRLFLFARTLNLFALNESFLTHLI